MLGGILAGALSGGAKAGVDIADKTIEKNQKSDLMRLEQQLAIEREDQIDRLRQRRAREDQTYNTTGKGAEEKLGYKKRETAVETEGAVEREKQLGPVKAENRGQETTAVGKAETRVLAERYNDKAYLEGKQKEADASESRSLRASRAASTEATTLSNADKREVVALRKQAEDLRARGDVAKAEELERRISGIQTGKRGGEKSYSDAVSAARELNKLADAAEMRGDEARARDLRQQAEDTLTAVTEKRGVSGGRDASKSTKSSGTLLRTGDVVDGMRFTGGDPNNQNSWVPVK